MLSVNNIAELIERPQSIDASGLDELEKMAQKYPYAQLFSILFLKGLKDNGDHRFEEELQKHSFRIGDRTQLYQIISSEKVEFEQVLETKKPEVAELVLEKTEEDSKLEVAEEIETNSETEVESSISPEKSLELDPLEVSIQHHIHAANYHLDELTEEEESALEERIEKKEQDTEESIVDLENPVNVDTTQSFSDWLTSDNNYESTENEDKKAIDAIVSNFSDFDPVQEELFGEVERPKKPFFSPAQKAKESLSEEGLPVSETLAKIYVVQGNYPKAIDAYERLSLKYPEKKIFFANLITDLKKKLNK